MFLIIVYLILGIVVVNAVLGVLALLVTIRGGRAGLSGKEVAEIIRSEADRLRQSVDDHGRSSRRELGENIRGFQETVLGAFRDLGEGLRGRITEFGTRLDSGIAKVEAQAGAIANKLDEEMRQMGDDATKNRENLRQTIEAKLDDATQKQGMASRDLRQEVSTAVTRLQDALIQLAGEQFDSFAQRVSDSLGEVSCRTEDTLTQMGQQQRERLDNVVTSLNGLSEKQEKTQEGLRQTVEQKLDAIKTESASKLDEIRKTVDEQLQATLTERVTSSFRMVHDQLEQVHRGLGEMQKLAEGVGDLKKVLSNVRARGVFGEVQLGSLIEQMFSPDQYIENAQIRDHSLERVEFAIKIPGRSGEGDVLLPIDAKFPIDDYERILQASERADPAGVEAAGAQLEAGVRGFARDVCEKYINPPTTTDIAILFLPVEGLYAEVLRRPGVIESIQEKHHVVIAGPTTLLAMLSAFRMSIRAVAIQRRSTEVWQILGAVRTEFDKHGAVLGKLQRQLEASLNTVDSLGTRTKAMRRKLQGVETIGSQKIEEVLGLPPVVENGEGEPESESDTA
jgi:DNA recombination protein RmuC